MIAGTEPIALVDRTTSTAMLSGAKWAFGAAATVAIGFAIVGRRR